MPVSMRNPYEDPDFSTNNRIIIDVLLLSLLAHAVIFSAIILITVFLPVPKLILFKPASPTVTLSLMPPPPAPAPPKKPLFIPTMPQANVPHKVQPIESANDTTLKSKSQTARAPDSILPDVNGKPHNPSLNESPNVPTQKPEVSSTPPMPKQAKPQKLTQPQPPQPAPKPLALTPQKKPPPPVDPNGFPALPAINAPTMTQENPSLASPPPAVSMPKEATSAHGAMGRRQDDNSPAAMASELGKYKQYLYSVVGSYWYPDINQHFGTIGVDTVHIKFTIHSDGTMSDVIMLEGRDEILKTISKHALVAPAPFKPFSESMIRQVGDSYTDDFTFSVYAP